MMIKYTTKLVFLLILILLVNGCVTQTENYPSGDNSNQPNIGTLSEKEKFAQYGAEIACESFEFADSMDNLGDDPDQINKIIGDLSDTILSINEKYGYEMDDVESLQKKYGQDQSYADLVVKIVKTTCPNPGEELQILEISRTI